MENEEIPRFSVSDFLALTNQTLEYAYPSVEVEGEVAEFKINQGKYVFFTLKDGESSVGCFMMVFQLRIPIEDGMKVIIRATPKLTKWGKFSLTVRQIRPSGEGSLKKAFALLKAKLDKEGLFAAERKRQLPAMPNRVAVISSTQAAGYADFMKIVGARWGGVQIEVAHVQVQGETASDQIIRALEHFNRQSDIPDVIVIIRGGGSKDDLAVFNDELLVRSVAASRAPVLTGIGHEIDESLVDLAADVQASTPSNAAERLVPEKASVLAHVRQSVRHIINQTLGAVDGLDRERQLQLGRIVTQLDNGLEMAQQRLAHHQAMLGAVSPQRVLERGYALLRGEAMVGQMLEIETATKYIKTEVQDVREK